MVIRTHAIGDIADYAAVGDDGSIYWTTWDPFSPTSPATTLWRQRIGKPAEPLGTVPDGRYLSLSWAGALVAVERRTSPEATRLVRLSLEDRSKDAVPLTEWMAGTADTWIDRRGRWIVWIDGSGLVVRHDGQNLPRTLSGDGRAPTLTPAHDAAVYQRSATAHLTVVSLATGAVLGDLDPRQFFGGEISSKGILAALTAHSPSQDNELCIIDVGARLRQLGLATPASSAE